MRTDFDPAASFVGDDGLEYEHFGLYLQGIARETPRNDVIRTIDQHPRVKSGEIDRWEWIQAQYWYTDSGGGHYANPRDPGIQRPQLWQEGFGRREGAGGANPFTEAAAAVRAARESEVQGGVGAPGHLRAPGTLQ